MVALPMNLSAPTPNHPIFCIFTAIHSFVTGEPIDFNFRTLICHSKSHYADEKSSLKAAWSESGDPLYRAMLSMRGTRHGPVSVCVCVCLSVCHKSVFYGGVA